MEEWIEETLEKTNGGHFYSSQGVHLKYQPPPSQQNMKHVLLFLNLWPKFHMMKNMPGAWLCSADRKPADVK